MFSFISIHILLVFLFFIFLLSLPHPSLFQMKHWKGKQQSETNVTSSSSCSFFLSICHPILPAIGTARECQMLSGVKTITKTRPFRSPTVGPFRIYLCVCVCALDTGDTTGRGRTVDGHVQETKDVSLTWTILYNPPAL